MPVMTSARTLERREAREDIVVDVGFDDGFAEGLRVVQVEVD
jgi:hypothetical protein